MPHRRRRGSRFGARCACFDVAGIGYRRPEARGVCGSPLRCVARAQDALRGAVERRAGRAAARAVRRVARSGARRGCARDSRRIQHGRGQPLPEEAMRAAKPAHVCARLPQLPQALSVDPRVPALERSEQPDAADRVVAGRSARRGSLLQRRQALLQGLHRHWGRPARPEQADDAPLACSFPPLRERQATVVGTPQLHRHQSPLWPHALVPRAGSGEGLAYRNRRHRLLPQGQRSSQLHLQRAAGGERAEAGLHPGAQQPLADQAALPLPVEHRLLGQPLRLRTRSRRREAAAWVLGRSPLSELDPMRAIRALGLTAVIVCIAVSSADARPAVGRAESVLVLKDGQVAVQRERFVGPSSLPMPPAQMPHAARRASTAAAKKQPPKGRATRLALDDLLAAGAIDQPSRDARQASLRRALRGYKTLTGTRKKELGAVIDNADVMARSKQLTASRLNAVFATLEANTSWWSAGFVPSPGARVSVDGSPVIWQYYPGQGIELQMLANFGKANALWAGKKKAALRALLDQLIPLAADRGGWPAFEYYFKFGGGKPPWTSSISQGTAVQALARAGQLLDDGGLTGWAQLLLGAFEQPPPAGVRQDTPSGPFSLIYSFAPNMLVINAHLQALVSLFDVAQITGDPRALALFQQGDAEAQAVLPSYDTGAWSMYDQSHESNLSYHDLVTTFLKNLCTRTATAIYCDTASRFKTYRKTAPVSTPVTQTIRSGKPAKLAFTVDKIARVGRTVLDASGQAVFATSAVVGPGQHFYNGSRPATAGAYTLRVSATDLAGNLGATAEGPLRILPPRKKPTR